MFGPAVITAAAGIGASDIIAASVVGARFGAALLWAVVIGAALKGLLSEGIARWQLASGTTLLQGVAQHLPRWVLILFTGYLAIWSIGVAAALANGCGLAIENISGGRIPKSWGAVAHVFFAGLLIHCGGLAGFTKAMKVFLGIMFVSIVYCALVLAPAPHVVVGGLIPVLPHNATPYLFSILGGIGGSVTLLAYNYLPANRGRALKPLPWMRLDILIAYTFTAVFGISIILIAGHVFQGVQPADHDAIPKMADMVGTKLGRFGFYLYSVGFWAAVIASLLGTWQTVPLLIADSYALLRQMPGHTGNAALTPGSRPCTFALAGLSIAGVTFAFVDRPLALIVTYTIVASAIVPFLAAVLLYLNTRIPWNGPVRRNSTIVNAVLLLTLLLFLVIGMRELTNAFRLP